MLEGITYSSLKALKARSSVDNSVIKTQAVNTATKSLYCASIPFASTVSINKETGSYVILTTEVQRTPAVTGHTNSSPATEQATILCLVAIRKVETTFQTEVSAQAIAK